MGANTNSVFASFGLSVGHERDEGILMFDEEIKYKRIIVEDKGIWFLWSAAAENWIFAMNFGSLEAAFQLGWTESKMDSQDT